MGVAVTIKDLAAKCGLSVSAISKALNNYPDISEETRAHVRKAAAELGYFPNAQARALKTNRTYNIGVVYEDGNRDGLLHNFFASILDGFKREIETSGFDITFINRNIGRGQLSLLNHCKYRNMDGALIACVDFYNAEVVELSKSDVPCVTIDHLFAAACPCAMSDNRTGMSELIRYVASMGHRRIGFVHGEHTAVTDTRMSSFFETMNALHLPVVPELLLQGVYHSPPSNYTAIKQLMALPEPPTCVLLTDDFAALGALEALSEMGLMPGRDISIAGYDGIMVGQLIRPRLTTYQQDTQRVGCEAARLLVRRIEHPNETLRPPVIVSGRLLAGETVVDRTEKKVLS